MQLARLTGLSPAATLHRVRALKDSGTIRIIRAHIDPATAGFALQVFVAATLTRPDPRHERAFEDQVRALPQILWADSIAGETDYLMSIVARDITELQQVLSRLSARGARRGDLPAAARGQAHVAAPPGAGDGPGRRRARAVARPVRLHSWRWRGQQGLHPAAVIRGRARAPAGTGCSGYRPISPSFAEADTVHN